MRLRASIPIRVATFMLIVRFCRWFTKKATCKLSFSWNNIRCSFDPRQSDHCSSFFGFRNNSVAWPRQCRSASLHLTSAVKKLDCIFQLSSTRPVLAVLSQLRLASSLRTEQGLTQTKTVRRSHAPSDKHQACG